MQWGDLSKYRNQLYGISMIWIVIFHVYDAFYKKLNFKWMSSIIFNHGNIGVDIFLLLSGISMYYAMRKYEKLNLKNIMSFYKKRLWKILKVYVFFCIPFLAFIHLVLKPNTSKFVSQLLFIDDGLSSFWFLSGIIICYLIYPLLEGLRRKGRKDVIVALILLYYVSLFAVNHYYPKLYDSYEIMWTRIPIFMVGSLFADKVAENRTVSLKEVSFFTSFILLKAPILYAISRISLISETKVVVSRLLMGWTGIGVIFIWLLFIKLYEGSKLDCLVSKIGTFTLEVYVFHIALRILSLQLLRDAGFPLTSFREILPYGFLFAPVSFIGGYGLSLILNRKARPRAGAGQA